MIDFLAHVVQLIYDVIDIISNTAERIDSINFMDSEFRKYLGYARYVMSDNLYMLFTTVVLIAIGVTIWTYLLKGIGMIKNLLPW